MASTEEVTRTGWIIISAVIGGVLWLLRGVFVAGLGKLVLYCLRSEKDAVRTFIAEDLFSITIANNEEAHELALKHDDILIGMQQSVLTMGAEINAIKHQTHGLEKLPEALQSLADGFQKLSVAFGKMEEREMMRDRWDGINERRHGPDDRRDG